jgi:hypothetical protein
MLGEFRNSVVGSVTKASAGVLRRQIRVIRLLEAQSLAVLELQRATITTMADAWVGWKQLQVDRLARGESR